MKAFLNEEDLVEIFPGTTAASWVQRRYTGTGPRFVKVGRKAFYRVEDVEAWVASQLEVQAAEVSIGA